MIGSMSMVQKNTTDDSRCGRVKWNGYDGCPQSGGVLSVNGPCPWSRKYNRLFALWKGEMERL